MKVPKLTPVDNAALTLIAGIRETANLSNPALGHATPDDIDTMIWDIEGLIESYREDVMSRKENTVAQTLAWIRS